MEQDVKLTPRKVERVACHALGEEVFLHDEGHGKVHVLNETARFIYDLCDGKTTETEVLAALENTFEGVSRDILRKDVEATLEQLLRLGLVSYEV